VEKSAKPTYPKTAIIVRVFFKELDKEMEFSALAIVCRCEQRFKTSHSRNHDYSSSESIPSSVSVL